MKKILRKLIKEAVNRLFETQDGNFNVIQNLEKSVMNSEIDHGNSFEIKEGIVDALRKNLTALKGVQHMATDEDNTYNYGNMYAYKLGTFYMNVEDEWPMINFKNDSIDPAHLSNSSSIFKVNTPFVVVYKDTFFDFGFCDENTSDKELEIFMKNVFNNNSSRSEEEPKGFKISSTLNDSHRVKIMNYVPKASNNDEESKEGVKFNSLAKGSPIFHDTFGWGIIARKKNIQNKPYVEVIFPSRLVEKLMDGSKKKPVAPNLDSLPHNLRGKMLTSAKLKEYLKIVPAEIKTLDTEVLTDKAREDFRRRQAELEAAEMN